MADTFEMKALAARYKDFAGPVAKVFLDGRELKAEDGLWLEEAEVTVSVGREPDMAVLTYLVSDVGASHTGKIENCLQVGVKAEIKAGYGESAARIFYGYLHQVSAVCRGKDVCAYQAVCLDVKGLMRQNSTWETSGKGKLKQALDGVLGAGMYAFCMDGRQVQDIPACMNAAGIVRGETDYDWLCRLADYLDFEFFVSRGKLFFRKAGQETGVMGELTRQYGLREVRATASLSGQFASVRMTGYNGKDEKVSGSAKRTDPGGPFGQKTGAVLSNSIRTYMDMSLETGEQAAYRAKALARQAAARFSAVEAVSLGIPEIVPGAFLKITDDILKSLSGKIYVEEVIHRLGADGYSTTVKGHR